MKKTITIGNEPYELNYDQDTAFKVLDAVIAWMEEHSASSCGEGLHQNDDCLIDAPTLLSDIIDDILQTKYVGTDYDPF